jgi:hypothetical protein
VDAKSTLPPDRQEPPSPEALGGSLTDAPDADLLHDLIDLWPGITAERRWRLVQLARDLHRASVHTNHHPD